MTQQPVVDETEQYENLLKESDALIHGARNSDYGHPLDDFSDTADYWTTWCHARDLLQEPKSFTPEDVAMMMVLLKISREGRRHKQDNLIDGPGYFGTLGMVLAERMRRNWGKPYEVVRRIWWRSR